MTQNNEGLVERLRTKARRTSEISRSMAEAKSLRQDSNTERRTDLYMWATPEQTDEWKAADRIEALSAENEALRSSEGELVRVLREAAVALALAAGKLNVALDGQEKYRLHRKAVLDAMSGLDEALSRLTTDDLKGRG